MLSFKPTFSCINSLKLKKNSWGKAISVPIFQMKKLTIFPLFLYPTEEMLKTTTLNTTSTTIAAMMNVNNASIPT